MDFILVVKKFAIYIDIGGFWIVIWLVFQGGGGLSTDQNE